MTPRRHIASAAVAAALVFFTAPAFAQDEKSWDGLWAGVQGKAHAAPIELSVTEGKVVSYTLNGAAYNVKYSQTTPTTIAFGDRNNYIVKLKRTSDTTAAGHIRSRMGVGEVELTKQ